MVSVRLIIALAALWFAAPAFAQTGCNGQFQPGAVCGNSKSGVAPPGQIQPIASSVFVTNGSGIPSWSTTLPSGLTIPTPALTGTPTAPTASFGTSTTQIATTAFVAAAISGGSVTSVGLALPSSVFSISGSPVTTTGTLTGAFVTQAAHAVFIGPTSSTAVPTFRALVGGDLPNPSASTLGGIESYVAVSNQWINAISTSGVPSSTQPAFSNISGQATLTQLPTLSANTVLGSITGSTPIALTTTQLTTLCNAFTASLSGCAPLSGGGTTNFLRADGTWAAPTVAATLVVGTTTISGGTNGDIEFNNAGVLGEKGVTGSGSVVLATGPTIAGTANFTGTFQFGGNTMTFPGAAATLTQTVASGALALATGAIGSGACTSAQTATATGTTTSDAIDVAFSADPTSTTGYIPSTNGMLTIVYYPTSNTVNFKVCNNTQNSITPGAAVTINWRVVR